KIGFIGLGRMGHPMARNLTKARFEVVGFDMSEAARHSFAQAGGQVGQTVADVAGNADLLITMLPTGKIVRQALLEEPGFAAALRPGALVIDMSSSAPTDTTSLAGTLNRQGVTLLDAPVSGGVAKAVDGTLAILVGGEEADVERVRPVLTAMGASIIHTGKTGSAHCMKALNNYVSAAGLVAVSEALHVGTQFGLNPETVVEALNASTGRNNTTERKALPFMVSQAFNSGFAMNLMAKDIGIAADLAADLNLQVAELALMARMWREASEALGPEADHTAMHQFLADTIRRKG
ncbi:MAG TPA: NAD(P)-dependent oxidoreductase, partial [Tianweitania sediminis]|nr:NAD(P)-dependent oxidoreductase [Tianweitania sediminis]